MCDIFESRIDLLEKMMVSTEELYKHTNKAVKYVPDAQQILSLTAKCQYVRIAYGTALTLMPQGEYTWKDCCEKAIEELADLVFAKKVINSRAIARWNAYFRQNDYLPHPNAWIESGNNRMHPLLFELFPTARQKFEWYAMQNLDKMSGEFMAAYIKEELIPFLFEELRDECEKMVERNIATIWMTSMLTLACVQCARKQQSTGLSMCSAFATNL
jgi:hypothetical protein